MTPIDIHVLLIKLFALVNLTGVTDLARIFAADGSLQTMVMYKIVGAKLSQHTFRSIFATTQYLCIHACTASTDCQSANYDTLSKECDLNMVDHTSYSAIGKFDNQLEDSKVFFSTRSGL